MLDSYNKFYLFLRCHVTIYLRKKNSNSALFFENKNLWRKKI